MRTRILYLLVILTVVAFPVGVVFAQTDVLAPCVDGGSGTVVDVDETTG